MAFEFDKNGLCTNPNFIDINVCPHELRIFTAKLPNQMWVYGLKYKRATIDDYEAYGLPCNKCNGTFSTQDEAQIMAINKVIENKTFQKHKKMLLELKNRRNDITHTQLTLPL